MKTKAKIEETLLWHKAHLEQFQGHLEEDPDVVYIQGFINALEWVLVGEVTDEEKEEEIPSSQPPIEDLSRIYPIQGNLFDGIEG